MSAPSIDLKEILDMSPETEKIAVTQGLLFITPSLVITVISYILFFLLRDMGTEQLNTISVTITSAIILSLVGTAGMQILVYRIIDEGKYAHDMTATARSVRMGVISAVLFSAGASALLYSYFQNALHFPVFYFAHFSALLTLYSLTWIIIIPFWAAGAYRYPALIFTFSYLVVLSLSYGLYQMNPDYVITGYTIGTSVLLLLSLLAARGSPGGRQKIPGLRGDLKILPGLIFRNLSPVIYNVCYVLAIFLDKIIVWVTQGRASGKGLLLTGPYTTGAFLGLIPMFSVMAIVFFTSKVRLLTDDMYLSRLTDIQKRTRRYKYLYDSSLRSMLLIWAVLFTLITCFSLDYIRDPEVVKVAITVAAGSLFFLIIAYDAVVLPFFGRIRISMISMLLVCIFQASAVFFVGLDVWYAAAGFLAGSFAGFLVSHFATRRLLSVFEYNLFRLLILSA
ncbi:MAG: exopolysaccharide Pel transporter PelG [Chloroflexota bacterium]